jgi:hypothetical protein
VPARQDQKYRKRVGPDVCTVHWQPLGGPPSFHGIIRGQLGLVRVDFPYARSEPHGVHVSADAETCGTETFTEKEMELGR